MRHIVHKSFATAILAAQADDEIRKSFEAHYSSKLVFHRTDDGAYANVSIDNDWRSYQRGWKNCEKASKET